MPEVDAPAGTLRAALDAAFALNPRLRDYVLDEQGHMRGNVVAFIDGRRCMAVVRDGTTCLGRDPKRPVRDAPPTSCRFGGGYDVPGIHSICPHPTRAAEVLVGSAVAARG
jgi:hypothetical protein